MATGATLLQFVPQDNEPPSTNYATFDVRNGHPVLNFDTATQETAIFSATMPRNYSGLGLTVYLHWAAATATSGTIGWGVSFERVSPSQQDIDSDGFATEQIVTAATVPAVSGNVTVSNVAVTNGVNIDSIAVGDLFRLRVRRDVATDTALGDAQLCAVEVKET